MSVMDSSDDEKNGVIVNHVTKDPGHNSSTKFIDEVLSGPSELCRENFRMDKQVFYKLCDVLQAKGLLRHTTRIKIEEQLGIFLFIIGHNQRTRAVQERFRYSGETISRHFNNVLNAIMQISLDFFENPGSFTPPEILHDPRFHPYFKDCVGTVNGIHIPVMVGVDEQGPFRNSNGFLSQNVLAACSFDLRFHYVLAGWEGSAPDARVLNSALTRRNNLCVPEGKYYLVNTKYPNMPGFVAPYHGVYYPLNEFPCGFGPQDAKELFNHRHSLLQDTSDRIFRILKERFPILLSVPPYPLQTQVKLVIAACAIHNYIRQENSDDWLFKMHEEESEPHVEPMMQVEIDPLISTETPAVDIVCDEEQLEMASQVRDSIAAELWNDYMLDLTST
ncbi:hypothetical protein NE237_026540 [Protea cynaroides]|uniref:DDE Tnp4 domain-containing protein n=1 Tax=Protea cynaroides TaxID=273540 RepID=A0A9Q0H578_9MAGN|nr:hypothetical protein NE237_026540 [Protea cynaroides]